MYNHLKIGWHATESARVNDAAIIGSACDDARNETSFGRLPQDFVDSHCQLVRSFELNAAI
jgi:hypothetical protein